MAMLSVAVVVEGSEATRLNPGAPIESQLKAGASHTYDLEIAAGTAMTVRVDQQGIDIVVEVKDPRGGVVVAVDALLGREGMETLLLEAASTGRYRVTVRSSLHGVPDGRYEIRADFLPAIEDWRTLARLEAERAWTAATAIAGSDVRRDESEGDVTIEAHRAEQLEIALERWQRMGDEVAQARTWQLLGALADRQGDPRRAVANYQHAAELWRRSQNRALLASSLGSLGLAYHAMGENRRAVGYLEEALALRQALGQREREAETRNQLCLIQQRIGLWSEARECYERVLTAARDVDDFELEARALNNLGGVYWNLGEPESALSCYGRALELRRDLGDIFGQATTLNNLGALYRGLGEIEEALVHYAPALEIFETLGDRYWQARTLNNLGVAYSSLGDLERAQSFLMRALPLRRAVGDGSGEAVTLRGLGAVTLHLGERPRALAYYRKALERSESLGDRRGVATSQKLLARVHLEADEPEAAQKLLDTSLANVRELGKRQEQAEVLELLARAHLLSGRVDVAKGLAGRSLRLHRRVQNLPGEVTALVTLADVERQMGRLDGSRLQVALGHLDGALAALEVLHQRLGEPAQRAVFSASQRRAYELKIHILMQLHVKAPDKGHDRQAFEVSERSRTRALMGSLRHASGGLARNLEPDLEARLRSAERRVVAQTRRHLGLAERVSIGDEAVAAKQAVHSALGALEAVRAEIRRQDSRAQELTELAAFDVAAFDVAELQKELDPQTLLLEFLLADEQSYVWAVTDDTVVSHILPPRSEIESLAYQTYTQLSASGGPSVASRESLRALGRVLLDPGSQAAVARVAIVADGALHLVPFAALTVPGSHQPLVVSHDVVMLPSLSALATQRRRSVRRSISDSVHKSPAPTVAIFADPLFDRLDPRLTGKPEREIVESPLASRAIGERSRSITGALERLPHTRLEAEAIAALVPEERRLLALGPAARRSTVVDGGLRDFSILHFATHGFVDPAIPELSGLVLSRFDSQQRPIDSFLGLHDVTHLRLNADLVVLSGCQTALGKEVHGEGWLGLARGFSYAGVPRVVSSLWQVRDQATASLMAHFYGTMLTDGQAPAAALRLAQLEVRRQRRFRDPYYWAAFVFEGDWR